jgi:glycerate kinase
VVAPDKFAGSLSASEVARAIEHGWRSAFPHDEVDRVPLSDGGPGFIDCLETALPGRVRSSGVPGPMGSPVAARVFVAEGTWYIEAAQANGLHLVPVPLRDPKRATSAGVGHLVATALAAGARRIVVGLGGSATNDAGAGLLGALGALAWNREGAAVDLTAGPTVLPTVAAVALQPAVQALADVELVIASDVDNPLLGTTGATSMFAAQKGADAQDRDRLEAWLTHWVRCCVAAGAAQPLARAAGAGAAGGLGYGLLLLGGTRVSGIGLVVKTVALGQRCQDADIVFTGEGQLDEQSLRGKVVTGVVAAAAGVPVVVIAGQSRLPQSAWRGAGIARVETLCERATSIEDSIARGTFYVSQAAAEVAAAVKRRRQRRASSAHLPDVGSS